MNPHMQHYFDRLPMIEGLLSLADGINSAIGYSKPSAKERMRQPWLNHGHCFRLIRADGITDFGRSKVAIEEYLSSMDEGARQALAFIKGHPEITESFLSCYLGLDIEKINRDIGFVAENTFYAWLAPHLAIYKLNASEVRNIGHQNFMRKRRKRVKDLNKAIDDLKDILLNNDEEFEDFFIVRKRLIENIEAAREIADIKAMELSLYRRSSHKLAEGIFVSNAIHSLAYDKPCSEHKLREFVTCLSSILYYERDFTSVRDRKEALDEWISNNEWSYQYKTASTIAKLIRKFNTPLMVIPGINVLTVFARKAFRL